MMRSTTNRQAAGASKRSQIRHAALILAMPLGVITSPAVGADFHPVVHVGWYTEGSMAISGDGNTVVAGAPTGTASSEALRWTVDGGLQWLGHYYPPRDEKPNSYAFGVTPDGSVIVGSSFHDTYHVINLEVKETYGFRWENGNFLPLPWASGDDEAYAYDVTADGTTAVGGSYEVDVGLFWITSWWTAVKWVNGNLVEIGGLDGDDDHYAVAVSDDGGVIVGLSGDVDDYWRPYAVWSNGTRHALQWYEQTLQNNVWDVSPGGQWAVGSLKSQGDILPIRWSLDTQLATQLPLLPGDTSGAAMCISGSGDSIGGNSRGPKGYYDSWKAVLWQQGPTSIPTSVESLLRSYGLGQKIAGWKLTSVEAISEDGRQMAGLGVNPQGQYWIWYADLRTPPLNDTCDQAQFIGQGPLPSFDVRSTVGTTKDAHPGAAGTCTDGPDAWYEFTTPTRGYLRVDVCNSHLVDPVLSVYRGCPGDGGTELACAADCSSDPSCGGACIDPPAVPVEPGQRYFIRVAGAAGESGGSFTLHTQLIPHADECADAPLIALSRPISGVTSTATVDAVDNCGAAPVTAPGVWYRVIGTGSTMTASLCGASDYDTRLSIYCGGCSSPTCLVQNDDSCGLQSEVSWCAAPGQQYYILVHGYNAASGHFELNVTASGGPCGFTWNCAPANDNCSNAIPLTGDTVLLDNGAATGDIGGTNCGGVANDLWHTYTPTCTGQVVVDTCQLGLGTLDNTVVSVLNQCGGFELNCNDDYQDADVDCGRRSAVEVFAYAGQTLRIRSGGYPTLQETGTYPLRVSEVPAPVAMSNWTIAHEQGAPIGLNLDPYGGCPPFVTDEGLGYFISADGLPDGLSVDSYGVLSGTPPFSGEYEATVTVNDREITTPGATAYVTLDILASNDDCADAMHIGEDRVPFGNQAATTDGPAEQEACGIGPLGFQSDLWFLYESSCDGIATVDLCDSDYDTIVAVYPDGSCPTDSSAIACNDDACDLQSNASFRVQRGSRHLIRVGGYNGQTGNGVLNVTCFDDCNENGINDQLDLTTPATTEYHPVDFSFAHNANLQAGTNSGFPTGDVVLGGVPFSIPAGGNNYWHSVAAQGPNPHRVEIPINRYGVAEIHTLMNTYWGVPGPTAYAVIEFFGADGAFFRKDLIGNVDIRDYHNNVFTNTINGTTTVDVVNIPPDRLDKQEFDLPADFQDETLTLIRLTDNGDTDLQRIFLAGVTVATKQKSKDCNANLRPDECDMLGDANGDQSIGLIDWQGMYNCLTPPCPPMGCPSPNYLDACCAMFDYDADGDVDVIDAAVTQRRYQDAR